LQLIYLNVVTRGQGQTVFETGAQRGASMIQSIIALIGIPLVVAVVPTTGLAFSKRTVAAAKSDIRNVLRLMDKDVSGTVSKQEFMQFMSETFDRLDVDRSGQLEPAEMRPMKIPSWNLYLRPSLHNKPAKF
jgi:EF hand